MRWLRAIAVWVLLMSGEVVHGIARTLYLAPAVGDFRARQLAVFSGSLLILLITTLTIRWLQPSTTRSLLLIGVTWVALTLAFEIGVARLVGYSWNRIASDYDLLHGGLMPIGLGVMATSPWMALRLRRLPGPWNPALILMLIALVSAPHVVGSMDASAIGSAQASCPGAAQAIRGVNLFVRTNVAIRPDVQAKVIRHDSRSDVVTTLAVHLAYHFETHPITQGHR